MATALDLDIRLYNGCVTITNPITQEKRVFEVRTETWRKQGECARRVRTLALKQGHQLTPFAFFTDEGEVQLYRKFRKDEQTRREFGAYVGMLLDAVRLQRQFGYEVRFEQRCRRCGRALTDTDSLKCGVGPTCLGHMRLDLAAKSLKKMTDAERAGELRGAIEHGEYERALLCVGYTDNPDQREVGRHNLKRALSQGRFKASRRRRAA